MIGESSMEDEALHGGISFSEEDGELEDVEEVSPVTRGPDRQGKP